jgi:hypothetical protein
LQVFIHKKCHLPIDFSISGSYYSARHRAPSVKNSINPRLKTMNIAKILALAAAVAVLAACNKAPEETPAAEAAAPAAEVAPAAEAAAPAADAAAAPAAK